MTKAKMDDYALAGLLAGIAWFFAYNAGFGWLIPALFVIYTAGWVIFNVLHGLPKFYNM